MPKLSQHYAKVTLPDGSEVEPTSVSVTADESWAPYVQGTVVIPTNLITGTISPTIGSRIKIRLQQDLANLLYVSDITADLGGDVSDITAAFTPSLVAAFTRAYTATWNVFTDGSPISKVTTDYTPVTPLKLTNANLSTVWKMTKYLQVATSGATSTVFSADLGVRNVTVNYVTKETTLDLSSDEAIAQDVYGFGDPVTWRSYTTVRAAINVVLAGIGATLEAGTADAAYPLGYVIEQYSDNVSNTPWDFIETAANANKFKVYCDELRRWYLVETTAVAGTLELKDTDNITAFEKKIDRDANFYNQAIIEYIDPIDVRTLDIYSGDLTGGTKTYYEKKEGYYYPGTGAAQAVVERSINRGETYSVEAIANFDARPRQTLTVDITGEPIKTGVVQSITWQLPSARMSVDIRNLEEL
jgi:hypothetical protein